MKKMHGQAKVMVIDDDENILFAFKKVLEKDGFTPIFSTNGFEVMEKVQAEKPDVIFLDIAMPGLDGLEILKQLKDKGIETPVVIITGYGTMQTAVKAIQLGAFEYLTKPLDINRIRLLIQRAIETNQLKNKVREFEIKQSEIDYEEKYQIIGNSPKIQEIFKLIGVISMTPNTTPVLITGESGTGKELVARAIHRSGANASEPFVAINCPAVPENLLESEFFGHEKGAFTGADKRKYGKFEIAGKGTILLDEITGIPSNLQQKLLRVIQEREFQRVGGNETIKVEARFIATTNLNIIEEVKKGNFREDLYYRLSVFVIEVPPLRERREDIPLLANYFLKKYSREMKKNVSAISDSAMEILVNYDYPGNVRELQNIIERCVILSKGGIITPDLLPENLKSGKRDIDDFNIPIVSENLAEARRKVIEAFEKKFLIELLKKNRGNVSLSAKSAGVTRQNLTYLLKKYNIDPKSFR
ncbi:sigma-54-dependent transcriptional regulator [Candidatus Kryptonium thompsonii]|nr:sigma-54 dependent transcriptional regulator [Candidatus Kryptonium thompsoni]